MALLHLVPALLVLSDLAGWRVRWLPRWWIWLTLGLCVTSFVSWRSVVCRGQARRWLCATLMPWMLGIPPVLAAALMFAVFQLLLGFPGITPSGAEREGERVVQEESSPGRWVCAVVTISPVRVSAGGAGRLDVVLEYPMGLSRVVYDRELFGTEFVDLRDGTKTVPLRWLDDDRLEIAVGEEAEQADVPPMAPWRSWVWWLPLGLLGFMSAHAQRSRVIGWGGLGMSAVLLVAHWAS